MNRIRTTAYTAYLLVSTLFVALLALPTLLAGERAARSVVNLWARLALHGLRVVCGVSHRIEGRQHIPASGAIVAANHQSMWETIALFTVLEKPAIVIKKELLRIPIYGWWARRAGCIPVDRKAGARAIRELRRAANEKIAAGAQIVLFPEGTRARHDERLRLQPGIAGIYTAVNAPCTPAIHNSGTFWRHPGGVNSLKTPGVITLRFQPAIAAGMARKPFMRELDKRFETGRRETADFDPVKSSPAEVAAEQGAAS